MSMMNMGWSGYEDEYEEPKKAEPCAELHWVKAYSILHEDTLVEAIEGYRVWKVSPDGRLRSFYMDTCIWTPGQKLVATCMSRDHCSYDGLCAAGIYALKKLDTKDSLIMDASDNSILGKVWVWGWILDCNFGYRAEFAYPSAIYETRTTSAAVAQAYGVPLLPNPLPPPTQAEFEYC